MKKRLLTVVLAAVLALAVCGCGASDAGNEGQGSPQNSAGQSGTSGGESGENASAEKTEAGQSGGGQDAASASDAASGEGGQASGSGGSKTVGGGLYEAEYMESARRTLVVDIYEDGGIQFHFSSEEWAYCSADEVGSFVPIVTFSDGDSRVTDSAAFTVTEETVTVVYEDGRGSDVYTKVH